MTKMSLSHDEAGAADRQPFVWCRGRMDRTACLGRGLRPTRPGLDGQAAGWQGSCRPPTGSGAAARKGWAARSPGGEPARLGPRAGLEAQTGTSPGLRLPQAGRESRWGPWGGAWSSEGAGGGGGPGKGSFPHAWPFLSSRLCPWKRKRRSPRSLSAGNKELAAGRGRALTHVPQQEPPRQAGDMPAVGLVTGSRLMQCARTAMTIKGSLHPLPAERWHCGLEHPPGLSVMMGSGYPEKQVLALFSAEWTPAAPTLLCPPLPSRAGPGLLRAVPRVPPAMAFIGPGAGALGRGQGRPLGWWHRASPPIFPAARVRHPGARTLSCSHCPGATGCQAGAGQGPRSGPPGSQGESSGPAVDALASGLELHPGGGDATLAMDVGASGGRKPLPAPAPRPRPGEGRGGEGEASRRPGVSPAPRVLTAPGDDDSAAVHFTRV